MSEPEERRRWDDVPNSFEWRLLHLEKQDEDKEVRLRGLESRLDVIETKLDTISQTQIETKNTVDAIREDRYKTLWGFILTGVTIIGTAIAEYFLKRGG